MALVQFATKLNPTAKLLIRNFSAASSKTVNSVKDKNVKKSVFISQSTNVYTNLALEDWLYRNFNLNNHHILMLWRNDPCVVIGRHQNPWVETNTSELTHITDSGVQVARRSSSGGANYHDQGNLNLTFFTPVHEYNHKHNLEVITRALFREYGIKLEISSDEDLLIRNAKVSGTAAKLGHVNAYHHCTLSVNVDKVDHSHSLQQTDTGIKSNAPKTKRSKILNLCEENPKINFAGVLRAIGWEYMRTPVNSFKDGGTALANKQNGFQMINPTEQWFPGISKLQEKFSDWEWCYGETPKFTVTKSFPVPHEFLNGYNGINGNLSITMVVEHGRINDVLLHIPPGLSTTGFTGKANVITSLKNQKFTEDVINFVESSLCGNEYGYVDDKDKFITECVRRVMTSV